MRFISLSFLICVGIATCGMAQSVAIHPDSTSASSATIYLQGTIFGGNRYVQNGTSHPAGGSFGRVGEAVKEVPEAYRLASEGSRIVTHGRLISLLGAAIGASTFFVHGERWELGLSIGGFAVAAAGGAVQMKGRNRVNEAVWVYNEALRDPNERQALRGTDNSPNR